MSEGRAIVKPQHLEAACFIAEKGPGYAPTEVIAILDNGAVFAQGHLNASFILTVPMPEPRPRMFKPASMADSKVVCQVAHDQAKQLVSLSKKAGGSEDPALVFTGQRWELSGVDVPMGGEIIKPPSGSQIDQFWAVLKLVKESEKKQFNFDLPLISDGLAAMKAALRGTPKAKGALLMSNVSFLEAPSTSSLMMFTCYSKAEISIVLICPIKEPPGSEILFEF